MKLMDYGENAAKNWFQQILEWSRKKITIEDNIDGIFVTTYLGTAETVIDHTLGRVPRYILEIASYPNGTSGINFTQAPTDTKLFLKRNNAGSCVLLLM
jgi:hypothetical protein